MAQCLSSVYSLAIYWCNYNTQIEMRIWRYLVPYHVSAKYAYPSSKKATTVKAVQKWVLGASSSSSLPCHAIQPREVRRSRWITLVSQWFSKQLAYHFWNRFPCRLATCIFACRIPTPRPFFVPRRGLYDRTSTTAVQGRVVCMCFACPKI